MSVTRDDLAAAVAAAIGCSTTDARQHVDDTLARISDALVSGDAVKISRFGAFIPRKTKSRLGRNPKRPEEQYPVPSRNKVIFRPMIELLRQLDPALERHASSSAGRHMNPPQPKQPKQPKPNPRFDDWGRSIE